MCLRSTTDVTDLTGPIYFLEETEPRAIVANPALLERAIDHYTKKETMPDITDKPEMSDKSMCL